MKSKRIKGRNNIMTEPLKYLNSEEELIKMEEFFIDWQKKFVAGEQNSFISDQGVTYQGERQFYWQQYRVYNILKPIVDNWLKSDCISSEIWGKGKAVDQLIPYQRQYNRYKNQVADMSANLALPIMLVEDGSLDVDELAEEGLAPGKILIYRQNANAPQVIPTVCRDDIEFINHLADEIKIEMEQLANQLFENMDKNKITMR